MSLLQLTEEQKLTAAEIKRIVTNYRKDPVSRKTLDYLQSRLLNLDELWCKFEATDNKIRESYSGDLDHPYYTEDFYGIVKEGYEKVRRDIEQKISLLRSQNFPSDLEGASALKEDDHSPDQLTKTQGVSNNAVTTPEINNQTPHNTSEARGISRTTGTVPKASTGHNADIELNASIHKQNALLDMLHNLCASLPEAKQSEKFYELKSQTLSRYLEQAQLAHQKIWEHCYDPLSSGYNIGKYFNVEELAQNKLIELHNKWHSSTGSQQNTPFASAQHNIQSAMRLPKISLPKFDGDYLKWRQFCDLFTELVHNQSIADCQKMWYLKTSLCGEAEKLIRHLTTSEANYSIAWKIINERYENTRLLTTALLNRLLSQTAITNEAASAIKNLHDTTQECLLGLEALQIDTSTWDPLLVHILTKKLDKTTHALYEQSLKEPRKLQSVKGLLEFLELRFQSLEALGNKRLVPSEHYKGSKHSWSPTSALSTSTGCSLCRADHQLFVCPQFLQLSPLKRLDHVKRAKLCTNCLKSGHGVNACLSRSCTKCFKRHNTLVHVDGQINKRSPRLAQYSKNPASSTHQGTVKLQDSPNQQVPTNASTSSRQSTDMTALTTGVRKKARGYVLLSTVTVTLSNDKGTNLECRAILDSGSQLNFVTEKIVKRLNIRSIDDNTAVEGIGQKRHRVQGRVNLHLMSKVNGFETRLEAHILPRIISPQPSEPIDISAWPIPDNIVLADANFNQSADIDLLLGAELYFSLLSVGQIKLGKGLPTLQNTVLGWTISGKIAEHTTATAACGICTQDEALERQIENFWRIEETEEPTRRLTSAEQRCESHFIHTTRRDHNGCHLKNNQ